MTLAAVALEAASRWTMRSVDNPPAGTRSSLDLSNLPWNGIFIAIGFLAVVVTCVYLRRTYRNWSDDDQVSTWASQHGMRYSPHNDALSLNWPEKPFGYAARTCYNVVNGSYRGHHTTLFNLGDRATSSATGRVALASNSGLQEQVHGHIAAVAVMDLPYFIETDLTLRPLRGLSRLWAHDGEVGRIELENEDFNRLYDVICTDRDLAYAFLTPRTMEVLLTQPPVEIRVRGIQVLLIADDPLRPDRMSQWVAMLSAVIENVSPYVWTDRGSEAVAETKEGWGPTTQS